jgi:hypothetical protein
VLEEQPARRITEQIQINHEVTKITKRFLEFESGLGASPEQIGKICISTPAPANLSLQEFKNRLVIFVRWWFISFFNPATPPYRSPPRAAHPA